MRFRSLAFALATLATAFPATAHAGDAGTINDPSYALEAPPHATIGQGCPACECPVPIAGSVAPTATPPGSPFLAALWPLLLALVPTVLTGMAKNPRTSGLVPAVQFLMSRLSLVHFADAPGTFKAPVFKSGGVVMALLLALATAGCADPLRQGATAALKTATAAVQGFEAWDHAHKQELATAAIVACQATAVGPERDGCVAANMRPLTDYFAARKPVLEAINVLDVSAGVVKMAVAADAAGATPPNLAQLVQELAAATVKVVNLVEQLRGPPGAVLRPMLWRPPAPLELPEPVPA